MVTPRCPHPHPQSHLQVYVSSCQFRQVRPGPAGLHPQVPFSAGPSDPSPVTSLHYLSRTAGQHRCTPSALHAHLFWYILYPPPLAPPPNIYIWSPPAGRRIQPPAQARQVWPCPPHPPTPSSRRPAWTASWVPAHKSNSRRCQPASHCLTHRTTGSRHRTQDQHHRPTANASSSSKGAVRQRQPHGMLQLSTCS
jgi:hypothetical protein